MQQTGAKRGQPTALTKQKTGAQGINRAHWAAFGILATLAYFLFAHVDVIETANHSYLFLESLFSGRLAHFYTDVMAHENTLYYINNAHYNILVYLIFGIAELPVFIWNAIFGTAVNEVLLYYIGKLVSAAFFGGCIPLMALIGGELGLSKTDSRWAALAVALWPPAFFSALVMGQYDSITLFLILLALLFWLRGKLWQFTLLTGLGAASKFFPLLLFVPLLLLREKRPLHILKYGVSTLWLLLPSTLLYTGRDGDMGLFNQIMTERLFEKQLASLPLFPLCWLLLCFIAWLWKPAELKRTGLWLCTAVLCLFFLFVGWHPQWLILLAPFLVLTTFLEERRVPWLILDVALSAGFFLYCALHHPAQLEANLLDQGLIGLASGLRTTYTEGYHPISFYYSLVPAIGYLPLMLTGTSLLAHLALKVPYKGASPAARLQAGSEAVWEEYLPRLLWACFATGMAVWALPTAFTWLKLFGYL